MIDLSITALFIIAKYWEKSKHLAEDWLNKLQNVLIGFGRHWKLCSRIIYNDMKIVSWYIKWKMAIYKIRCEGWYLKKKL